MPVLGSVYVRTVDELRNLLIQGEAETSTQRRPRCLDSVALWKQYGTTVVATSAIVALGDKLPNSSELLPTVFSLLPDIRAGWLRIVLARLTEIGERGDVPALTEVVNTAGALAGELLNVNFPSLSPTTSGELERSILPAAAHEAPAFPVLLRSLAATAGMTSDSVVSQTLPDIVYDDPSTAWRPGRLLRMPTITDAAPATAVLSGALEGRSNDGGAMGWALHHPWAFLLAQMTFTKEAWEAERVSGGITFELEQAHVSLFQNPPRVEVVVTLPSGEEVRCGSLGELVRRTLAQLGVTVLGHRITASALDDRLGLVIDALQNRDVWRFEHGSGGRRPSYSIHPLFSDECYRALGSRAFYRLGSSVTAAIRRTAETWAQERLARASGGESA